MKEQLIHWLQTTDWNAQFETFLAHAYILYYLPFPLILFGTYYLLKSVNVPYFLVRSGIAIITTCGLYLHQKTGVTLPQGQLDFPLIGVVAKEVIIGSCLGLVAILIFFLRSIVRFILSFFKKPAI